MRTSLCKQEKYKMNMKQPTKQQPAAPANKAQEQKKPQAPAPAPQQKKIPGK